MARCACAPCCPLSSTLKERSAPAAGSQRALDWRLPQRGSGRLSAASRHGQDHRLRRWMRSFAGNLSAETHGYPYIYSPPLPTQLLAESSVRTRNRAPASAWRQPRRRRPCCNSTWRRRLISLRHQSAHPTGVAHRGSQRRAVQACTRCGPELPPACALERPRAATHKQECPSSRTARSNRGIAIAAGGGEPAAASRRRPLQLSRRRPSIRS